MRSLLLALLFGLFVNTTVAQAWSLKLDEDPLEDTRVAIASQASSDFIVGFKCWQGQPDETMLMLITLSPYDASADYRDEIEVVARVDKGEKHLITMVPRDFSGKLGLVAAQGEDEDLMTFLREVGEAKSRIALGFFNKAVTVPVKGSSRAISGLLKACEI